MLVTDLLDHCERTIWRNARSKGTLGSNLKTLRTLVGHLELTDLHYTRLEQLRSDLEGMPGKSRTLASPATVKRKMDTLSKALTHATKMTTSDGKPVLFGKPTFPTFEIQNVQDRVISDAETVALFEVIDARLVAEPDRDWHRFRALIRFLLDTACRRGEALRVHADHVETRLVGGRARSFVAFERYTTKSSKPRVLPLSDAVAALLPVLRLQAGTGPLFPFTPGELRGMWKAIRQDMKARGFDFTDVRYHTTRHTTLTKAMKKHPIAKVSKLAGHASVQITIDRYGHLAAEDLVDMVDDIAA